jgi:hypothetical protein
MSTSRLGPIRKFRKGECSLFGYSIGYESVFCPVFGKCVLQLLEVCAIRSLERLCQLLNKVATVGFHSRHNLEIFVVHHCLLETIRTYFYFSAYSTFLVDLVLSFNENFLTFFGHGKHDPSLLG